MIYRSKICKIFIVSHLGNQSLYWSFDTLDNLSTYKGQEQVNFDPRVLGQVLGIHVI